MSKKKSYSEVIKETSGQVRRMMPTEFAQEQGLDYHHFIWWDKEGLVTMERYNEIKAKIFEND